MATTSARQYVVLTALGSDRPGIVSEVTEFLTSSGCNVEESRMTILGGEFGLLMLVSVPGAKRAELETGVSALAAETGLEIRLKETAAPQQHRQPGCIPYHIRTYAADHEGIIHAISRALSDLGVNIVSASTSSHPAPISGTPLFQMEMEVDVPPGLELSAVRAAMDRVSQTQNADIEVSHAEGG